MGRRFLADHPLLGFLLITFGWTWSWDIVFSVFGLWEPLPVTFPRQWGLPIAAVVVLRASDEPLRGWLDRVLDWRQPRWLYLVAVFVPLAITNAQPVVRSLGGGTLSYAPPGSVPAMVLFVLANAVLLGGVEEVGWRGFLQPRLQERTSVLSAGLGVGGLWWAWHLPLFFTGELGVPLEPVALLSYTTFVLGAAAVLGALVNLTDWSVVPAMLMHASVNLGTVLEGSGGVLSGRGLVSLVVGSGLWWVIVAVLVLRYGRSMVPDSATRSTP